MNNGNGMSAETGAGIMIWKFGMLKVLGFGAALLGAGIMAIFRPPQTRKELFLQGVVALASSFMFGGVAVNVLANSTSWINLTSASFSDIIQFNIMVHGLIGAISWGVFGGLAVLRDKFGSDPVQTVKDIRDL